MFYVTTFLDVLFYYCVFVVVASFLVGLIFRKKGETLKETLENGNEWLFTLFLGFCLLMMAGGLLTGVGELIISFLERIWL